MSFKYHSQVHHHGKDDFIKPSLVAAMRLDIALRTRQTRERMGGNRGAFGGIEQMEATMG